MHTVMTFTDEVLQAIVDAEADPTMMLCRAGDADDVAISHVNVAAGNFWGLGDRAGEARLAAHVPAEFLEALLSARVWSTGEACDLPQVRCPGPPEQMVSIRLRRFGDHVCLTCGIQPRWGREAAADLEHYRLLAENASDVVFQSDADGVLTWVSPSVGSPLGRNPEELVGRRLVDYIHPEDHERGAVAQQETSEPTRYEARFRHHRGTWVWLAISTRAQFDAAGRVWGHIGSGRDISRRIAAEQAVVQSERRVRAEREALRATLDASLDPQVVLRAVRDSAGAIVDLEITDVNVAACGYVGRERPELLGRSLLASYPGESVQRILTWSIEVIRSGEPQIHRDEPLDSSFGYGHRWFDANLVKLADGVTFTWRDVTEASEAARSVLRSEEMFRLVAENSPIALALVSPDGYFLQVNPALCALLGRDADTLLSTSWPEITHPDDLDADLGLADEILCGQRDSYQLTKRYVRPDGEVVWGMLAVSCVRDEAGQVLRFIAQIVDVTELVHNRQALADSEQHYRLLAENTSDVVVTFSESGLLEWISPSVVDVFGWTPEDLRGQPIDSFISTYDWGQVATQLDDSTGDGMDAAGAFRVRRRDATWMWVDATASTVEAPDGELVRVARIRDVDAETRARIALERSEERFRAAMASTPVGMALVTRSGRFLQVNDALCRIVKRAEESLTGALVTTLTHPGDRDIDIEMWNALHSGTVTSITREKRLVDGQGSIVWVQQALAAVVDDHGDRTSFVAQFMDTTQAREARAQLDFQANHDPLTDLKNRRAVLETMSAVLAHAPRTGTELGVLYCDLDHFKTINDNYGHQAGDELLIEVARRIRASVRSGDTVGRIGGDEFVVLLAQIHDAADARYVAEQIRDRVSRPITLGEVEVTPTLSIGAAVAHSGDDPDAVLAKADRALYLAKEAGRDCSVAYDGDVD